MFFVKYHFVSNSEYYDRNVCTVGVLSQDGNSVLKHPMVLVHPYSLRSYIVCVFFIIIIHLKLFSGYVFSHIVLYLVCVVSLCFSSISSLKRFLVMFWSREGRESQF